jgi:hypothetical protein
MVASFASPDTHCIVITHFLHPSLQLDCGNTLGTPRPRISLRDNEISTYSTVEGQFFVVSCHTCNERNLHRGSMLLMTGTVEIYVLN